jgi:hypothetical protein
MFHRAIFLVSSIIISLCCCTWEGAVRGVFEILTVSEPTSAEEFLTSMYHEPQSIPPQITNFQGVRIEIPGFTSYYLRYNADELFVLSIVDSMPFYESIELRSEEKCEASGEYEAERFFPDYTGACCKIHSMGEFGRGIEGVQPRRLRGKQRIMSNWAVIRCCWWSA